MIAMQTDNLLGLLLVAIYSSLTVKGKQSKGRELNWVCIVYVGLWKSNQFPIRIKAMRSGTCIYFLVSVLLTASSISKNCEDV